MSSAALTLALGAAVLHATWNLLLARARNVEAATAVVLVLSLLMYAPVAAVTWDVDRGVWPYVVASAIFELAYIVLLAAAYGRAPMSAVYPIARGVAPVLVLLGALVVLGSGTTLAEATGVLLVGAGVALVAGLHRPDLKGLAFGFAIAGCIASYTLLDSRGIRHADPFGYLELVMVVPSLVYFAGVVATKGIAPVRRELGWATVVAALGTYGAYALALLALELAPAPSVAAVRETSVVIAVVLAAPVLRERVGRARSRGRPRRFRTRAAILLRPHFTGLSEKWACGPIFCEEDQWEAFTRERKPCKPRYLRRCGTACPRSRCLPSSSRGLTALRSTSTTPKASTTLSASA